MAVAIRAATRDDIDGIQRIADAAWHAAHEPIVGAEAVESFLDRFYDAESFEGYIDDPGRLLAVAIDAAGSVVGFVSARPDDETPAVYQLGRIYVSPDRWGQGIGRRLLDHAETEVVALGGDHIELGVMAENDRAVAFYETAGYDRVDAFHDDRIDTPGYTYAKEL